MYFSELNSEKGKYDLKHRISAIKLNALLDITKAINNNASTSELLTIYRDVLENKLKISKLILFSFNTNWECLLRYGINEGFEEINVVRDLLKFTEISIMDVNDYSLHRTFEIVVPVFHKSQPLSYVLIGDIDDDKVQLSPVIKHLPFVQTITNVIVVAIENKRLYKESIKQAAVKKELELASQMQNMLFPEQLPKNEQIDFDAFYLPHQEVGGDYYDLIWLNKNEFAFCMADISGKGLAAALLMSNFQANLRVLLSYSSDLKELVRQLNAKVMLSAKGEKFITFFIGRYNIQTRMLNYINSGHNPPILVNKNSFMFLRTGSTGLGMFEELFSVKEGVITIKENSLMLCYTDGLVESSNEHGEFYGTNRVLSLLVQNQNKDTIEINKNLMTELDRFKENVSYNDDIALLCGKFY